MERWERPPEELPGDPRGTVLILAEPSEDASATKNEWRFATSLRRAGACWRSAARLRAWCRTPRPMKCPSWNLQPKTYSRLLPSPLTHDAPEITMIAPDEWTAHGSQVDSSGCTARRRSPWWFRTTWGSGEVIWWASSSPLSNGLIRDKGNLAFFLNAMGPTSSRVLWDEYFHGARGSLGSYFAETPLPWAGLQIGLAFLAAVFTFSRRAGPDASAGGGIAAFAARVRRDAGRSVSSPRMLRRRPWAWRISDFARRFRENLARRRKPSFRKWRTRRLADLAGRRRRFSIHSPARNEPCAAYQSRRKRGAGAGPAAARLFGSGIESCAAHETGDNLMEMNAAALATHVTKGIREDHRGAGGCGRPALAGGGDRAATRWSKACRGSPRRSP